jgi:mannose-6-phosphate isomerase-like protein (cupin superfamily)
MDTLDFEPIIKTKAIVVKSAIDKKKDSVIMIAEVGPGESGPPMHIHPNQEESYEVLEGTAEFMLGDEKIIVRQGDKIEIPTNTPHTFKNNTDQWLRMRDTHTPALTFEEMMRELHNLVLTGKIRGFTKLKSLIYLSILWVKHKDVQRSTKPPFFVMKFMAGIGKLFGYKV